MLGRRFKQVIVRGDSAFAMQPIFDACDEAGALLRGGVALINRTSRASLRLFRASSGKPYRQREETDQSAKANRRRARTPPTPRAGPLAKQTKSAARETVDRREFPTSRIRSDRPYRLIARYQEIEEHEQGQLFKLHSLPIHPLELAAVCIRWRRSWT